MPKPQRHARIFERFDELEVGDALLLVNDHDPKRLRESFEREQPGSFGWQVQEAGPDEWRLLITKRTSTPLPRVIGDRNVLDGLDDAAAGAVWKLEHEARDLDSNLIRLPAGDEIREYSGPELDVLLIVLEGSGTLGTEAEPVELRAGQFVWLPRRSRRSFVAGPDGLAYLTVHQRRQSLLLTTRPPSAPTAS